ncbi:DUF6220 domain-containing protein [Brevibacillus sp. BC25]|uniref:DUF6220 domain-containing protein n=1 Tax=Brevibacillus sp. BC25 TaxID=1144308 RepID=UPI001EE646FE|nr:DUF6220 domain-containing protein [Brevibacillus sp. BC25]
MNKKISLPPPRVKILRYMFIVLAWVFFAFIIVQVSLAGLGLFVNGEHWEMHRTILSALHPVIALFLFWGSLSTVKQAHNLGGKKAWNSLKFGGVYFLYL